ncbi:aminopeptidase P family protein [Bacillus mycoides]|uniref:aminopeptidase P family protein n=1 Tax=Bacillus mycoides TaxID=1405 RepID=UPI001C02AF1F|nr:aminopeptidase P family protein [Bacillus mycoides]MCQ6535233.1 aminopeptidase P family protein [Bacillus mycoides]QWI10632.1 aminopeptidase P family protein [Bacillus mycoides]QWI55057.1 aminopeptidase P family protein [Bacillus mycoides]QWI60040.1 aminopeptidase P family protein [Bacillus mycoides]QWI91667.1 aminopeptidase P family protein [Bacillus mycoides]
MKSTFFAQNRERLVNTLPDESITILFAGQAPHMSADAHYKFVPNRNFYYLTGIDEPNVIFMLKKFGNSVEETLFIEKSDPVMEKWDGKTVSKEDAEQISGIKKVVYIESFEKTMANTLFTENVKHLYLDLERREWKGTETKTLAFAKYVREQYPHVLIGNVYPYICELRVFKTEEEIEIIKEAIAVTKEGIYNVLKHAKADVMEYELEAHFDFTLKSSGIKHHAFNTILASGKNATVLHYEDNDAQIQNGDLVLLDLGAQKDYYNADISYTFPASGTFSSRQKQIYNIVLKALKETTELIKPGLKFTALNEHTKKVLAEECKAIGLIQEDEELSKYYYHGVSHFLGLDTHDVGTYKDRVLEEGMVITIEPGLYIEEESIGIRIEDDILITKDGYENLSKDIIRTVEEIEEFMRENNVNVKEDEVVTK